MASLEKLPEGKRENIKKMPDMRLISKLTQAGIPTEQIEEMDRAALLESYAKLVLEGGPTQPPQPRFGYDPAIEKERLQIERDKLRQEAEFQREKLQQEAELQRELQREKLQHEAEVQREKREQDAELQRAKLKQEEELQRDKLKQEDGFQREKLRLQGLELQENRERNAVDRGRHDTIAYMLKLYGDAFRSAAVRMGKEAFDIIPFFQHCDKLFADLRVPDDLRVK